jgi:hypothetical protein
MLNINDVIAFGTADKPDHHRIVYIDTHNDAVFTIEIYGRRSKPIERKRGELLKLIEDKEATILPYEPYAGLHVPDNEIPEAERQYRDERRRKLDPILRPENLYALLFARSRGQLIRQLEQEVENNRKGIERDIRKWLQRGMAPNALRPDYKNCGAPGKTRVTQDSEARFTKKLGRPSRIAQYTGVDTGVNAGPKDQQIIATAYRRFVYKRGMTLAAAYLMMLLVFYFRRPNPSDEKTEICMVATLNPEFQDWVLEKRRPSRDQFYYWARKERKRFRGGSAKSERQVRHLMGRSFDTADYPTSRYQIDAWLADVFVVDPLDRSRILSRPVVYIVVDVYSHMIVGLFVTLLPPSWECAKIALCNAFTSKVEFCARYGITIDVEDWPAEHICVEVYADRGETDTKQAERMIEALDVHFINGPAYQPQFRGLVEGLFSLIRLKVIGPLPASIQMDEKPVPRRGKDYRLDACLTIYEITQILILFCIRYNHFHVVAHGNERELAMVVDGIDATPIDLWEWGRENKAGGLRSYRAEVIRRNLLPNAILSVTDKGLILKGDGAGLQYTCEREIELRREYKGAQLCVNYNPESVNQVFLQLDRENEPLLLTLHKHSKTYQGLTFNQYKLVNDQAAHKAAIREGKALDAEVRALADRQALVSAATKMANLAKEGKSDVELRAGIREQLMEARALERKELASEPSNPEQSAPTDAVDSPSTEQQLTEEKGFNYVGSSSITQRLNNGRS